MIKNLENFFLFTIFVLPFTLITGPAIPDLSIVFSEIFFITLFIYKKDIGKIFRNNIFIISLIFWIFLLIVSFFAENKILAFRDAIIFIRILLIPILMYYCISNNEKNLKLIITIIFAAVLFVSFDTIFQFTNYDPENGFGKDIFGFKPEFYGRLTGPFYNELIPGAFVSKFSLIGLPFLYLFIKDRKKQSFFAISYLSIVGIVCYISGERMAMATYLLGLIILILFFKSKRFDMILSLLIILTLSFIINKSHPIYNDFKVLESTPYHLGLKVEKEFKCVNNNKNNCKKIINLQPNFFSVLKNFNKSAYGQIYSLGLKMWYDHPIQGIGLNNFNYLCNTDKRYIKMIKNYDCVTHPHNLYLQWLVETGIFGLIFFLLYLFFIFRFIIKNNFNHFSYLSISTMIILFWPLMSTGSLLKNWMGVSTFFIIGLCISLNKIKQKI